MGAIGQPVDIAVRFRGFDVEIASWWSVRVRDAQVLASEVGRNAMRERVSFCMRPSLIRRLFTGTAFTLSAQVCQKPFTRRCCFL